MSKITLVVKNLPETDNKLLKKFMSFINLLHINTENIRVIIVMTKFLEDLLMVLPAQSEIVELNFLTRKEALEFLTRVFQVEKKWDLVKRYDLAKHRIMDIWENMNFSDDYAFHLSRMLTTKKNLDQIADEIEHVKFKQTGTEKTQVVDTRVILACSTICMQLVNLG